jgi:hypothetical protein
MNVMTNCIAAQSVYLSIHGYDEDELMNMNCVLGLRFSPP